MKQLLLIFLLAFLPLGVSAEDTKSHRMVVSFKSGEHVEFIVSEKPLITLDGNKFCVTTSSSTFDYNRSDIADFHFEETETDIETLEYVGNEMITIYNMSGHQVATLRGESKKKKKILIDTFNPGMYIIKIGNKQTIKYLKK